MFLAASRYLSFGALALTSPSAPAADGAVRSAPSRPAPAPAVVPPAPRFTVHKIAGIDYVSVNEVGPWLELKGTWTERGRRLTLTDKTNPARKLELEVDSRLAILDGLRIYLGSPTVLNRGQLLLARLDVERSLAAMVRPSSVSSLPPQPKVVALDAGHGGDDPGMQNVRLGLKEKVLALDVVMRAKKLLEAAGYQVVLTRHDDRALFADKRRDLLQRAEIANRAGADLFVSVHFNSLFPDTRTGGTEVYVYTPQHQRSSSGWGAGEDDDTRREAQPVNRYDPWSALLAHHLHREVIADLKTADRGQKTNHYLVLQNLNCPAVLLESVFLSSDAEARSAATPEYRQKIAQAIADGVRGYSTAVRSLRPTSAAAQRKGPPPRPSTD